MKYEPTVGLEIHAELKTRTKMFCNSKNDSDEEEPNVNICPVCMGHPGTLPVINKEAVRHVLRVGTAVRGELADYTEFDRKNYFYPDLPKGYQISQYKHPLVSGGALAGVKLTRIHLEEDTGRSVHEAENYSLIDFNRAGVPLMELVTEPVVQSAEEASRFAKELQLLLRYLNASDANMEKGEMRVEANISLKNEDGTLGTKVEVKNLNSFKSILGAITYEIKRQSELLEKGEKVVQETRGWNENRGKTFSQRLKEESHDYRYFPEPDLPPLVLSEIPEFSSDLLKDTLPELPGEKRERYLALGLKQETVELFLREPFFASMLDSVLKTVSKDATTLVANYITSDIAGKRESGEIDDVWLADPLNVTRLGDLIKLIQTNKLSSRGAKDTLTYMITDRREPEVIAKEKRLLQESNEENLREVVARVIKENPNVVLEYKKGKEISLQYLIGQGMKATGGSANPKILNDLFTRILKK